jgi:hypothetical protein
MRHTARKQAEAEISRMSPDQLQEFIDRAQDMRARGYPFTDPTTAAIYDEVAAAEVTRRRDY